MGTYVLIHIFCGPCNKKMRNMPEEGETLAAEWRRIISLVFSSYMPIF